MNARRSMSLVGGLFIRGMLCLAGVAHVAGAQSADLGVTGASAGPISAADATELTVSLRGLFADWKAIPSAEMAAKSPRIKSRIDVTLTRYVIAQLEEGPRPSAANVQGDLNKALTTAVWETIFGLSSAAADAAMKSSPPRPFAFVLQGSGPASDLYAAAFAIGYGNVFSTRVHAFGPRGGTYRAVNPGGSPLEGAVSDALPLRSFAGHELRLLIWSLHIGSPEGLTTVALYRFDGSALQTLWIEQNVPAAKVTLQEGLVVIESHSHAFTKDRTIFLYERRFYRQIPGGLKQVKTTRWTER